LKVGRVKFAVKEIRYKEKMEIDSTSPNIDSHISSTPSNILSKDVDDYEEYEDVESIMHTAGEDSNLTP